MQEVKTLLRDILKEQLAEALRTRVHLLIQEKVEAQVKEKVHQQVGPTSIFPTDDIANAKTALVLSFSNRFPAT
jgi:hypothetical protein